MSDIIRAIISGGAVAVEAKDTKLYLEIETERHDLDLKHVPLLRKQGRV